MIYAIRNKQSVARGFAISLSLARDLLDDLRSQYPGEDLRICFEYDERSNG